MEFSRVAREIFRENRLLLLSKLSEGKMSFSEIVKVNGWAPSTVSRTLSQLENEGLVRRDDGEYSITGTGKAILKLYESLSAIYEFREDLNSIPEFVDILPQGFLAEIRSLRYAEVMDLDTAFEIGAGRIASAKHFGLYIDKVISYDIYKLMVQKNLEGVSEKVISTHDTLFGRGSTFRQVLRDMNLSKEEYELIKSKVEVRVFDTPIQLGIIDGEFALLQLNDRTDRFYVSEDRRFVKWCSYLFWHLWDMAEDARFDKIVEEVMAEKGFS